MLDVISLNQQQVDRQPIFQQSQSIGYSHNVSESLVETFTVEGDRVTLSSQYSYSEEVTYTSNLTINNLQNNGYEQLRNYVAQLLNKQGVDTQIDTGNSEIDISQLSQEEAQELIADDGYFGVEQTSDRIVDFAIALSGNDPSRMDAILEGVENGFNEALEAFGGWLPDISYQTIDAVHEKLNSWADGAAQNELN